LVIESTDEYAAPRLIEMDKRIKELEKRQNELENTVEELKKSLSSPE